MPFPIGHTAIGLAAYETAQTKPVCTSRTAQIIYITVLANLPDMDILFGLMLQGNGAAYHRGPTHSLLFALLFGVLASQMYRLWPRIPRLGFGLCGLLIFSHVAADMFLTTSPVSLFWPLEIYWYQGHSTWIQVIDMVLFQSIQDAGIAVAALAYILVVRFVRGAVHKHPLLAFARRRTR